MSLIESQQASWSFWDLATSVGRSQASPDVTKLFRTGCSTFRNQSSISVSLSSRITSTSSTQWIIWDSKSKSNFDCRRVQIRQCDSCLKWNAVRPTLLPDHQPYAPNAWLGLLDVSSTYDARLCNHIWKSELLITISYIWLKARAVMPLEQSSTLERVGP